MGPPECGEGGEYLEGLGFEVMLDIFDLGVDGVGFQAEEAQEFAQGAVAFVDVACDGAALGCEGEAPISLVIHVASIGQSANHVGHGGAAQAEAVRQIAHACVAHAVHQVLDSLEMILGRFGTASLEGGGWGRFRRHGEGCTSGKVGSPSMEIEGLKSVLRLKHSR